MVYHGEVPVYNGVQKRIEGRGNGWALELMVCLPPPHTFVDLLKRVLMGCDDKLLSNVGDDFAKLYLPFALACYGVQHKHIIAWVLRAFRPRMISFHFFQRKRMDSELIAQ